VRKDANPGSGPGTLRYNFLAHEIIAISYFVTDRGRAPLGADWRERRVYHSQALCQLRLDARQRAKWGGQEGIYLTYIYIFATSSPFYACASQRRNADGRPIATCARDSGAAADILCIMDICKIWQIGSGRKQSSRQGVTKCVRRPASTRMPMIRIIGRRTVLEAAVLGEMTERENVRGLVGKWRTIENITANNYVIDIML
jgi:hypothetical protein